MSLSFPIKVTTQRVELPVLEDADVVLDIRREDLIHPLISGNKYRKLKYNLIEAKNRGLNTLLTFGGAYSNHIAATAFVGREYDFRTIGVIRGEELSAKTDQNPTLTLAAENGMTLEFVSREMYRQKYNPEFLQTMLQRYGDFYLLPEGGTNSLAVKGCEEILSRDDQQYGYICSSVGTGGTLAGLINASFKHQKVIGFPALKGSFLNKDICNFARNPNWCLEENYHFGGYAKVNKELIHFINDFREKTGIPLDPVYTGKMMYGILDKVSKGDFPKGSKILAIHTGGLQGIAGMNEKLMKKNLPTLCL
ncbi:MAG: 1-aminocyclopropane-1-carboxylate deaminase/D-cysteine desulfhydrase [Flavobacteriaceae bacterium]|nr:1-aminocyclopropane-1-carboxylate deaminase/D-cysteine desulfhydrase [Flavobacteriaceae bacterium]